MPPIAVIQPETLSAWKGPSLLVTNTHGECRTGIAGYYFRETRCLSALRLTIDGNAPWPCEAASPAADVLAFTFVYPELTAFGGGGTGQSDDVETLSQDGIAHRSIALRLLYTVEPGSLRISLSVQNHGRHEAAFDVAWAVDADFADLQEAFADERQQQAPVECTRETSVLRFRYQHPALPFGTAIVAPQESRVEARCITVPVRLASQETQTIELTIVPDDPLGVPSAHEEDLRNRALAGWRDAMTRVTCPSNRLAETILHRQVDDFASLPILDGKKDEWLVCQAGMPMYPALFGRDAITAGWQAAFLDRATSLDAALTLFGRRQATEEDPWRDAQPGRTAHSFRRGPLARLGLTPHDAYYGDFAGPLMFVISLANLYGWTGETASLRRHWDAARRILDWASTYGDRDGDGYLEYATQSRLGTKNQGWKDSGDAIVYDDGSAVPAPIATCELQGYWYAAQFLMAIMSVALGQYADARGWWKQAADLKARFNRDWWIDDTRSIALAMDPDKRLVTAATSNIGHCIATGIVSDEHLPPLVGRLFAPDLFSGWGIRTLSSEHRFYDPLSYHRGAVWPVEQATIAFGLRRFGFDTRAIEIAQAMFDLAELYAGYRVPECVGGYARGAQPTPGAYPRANAPQLWNATAYPLLIHTLLGLQPVAPANLLVVAPALPAWLPEIVLHDLRIGGATATIRFWRDADGASHAETLHRRGTLRVVTQPPPESLSATVRDRLSALADTLVGA